MKKEYAWSYSRLTTFESCPRKYYHLNIIKDVKDKPNKWAIEGSRVHNALDSRLKKKTPLPNNLKHLEEMAINIENGPGELHTEKRLAFDKDFNSCGWMASNVYVRGIMDVMRIIDDKAWIGDYKTGKWDSNVGQLQLQSIMTFFLNKQINTIKSCFIWLKDMRMDTITINREDVENLKNHFVSRANKIKDAADNNNWIATENEYCKYCPVKEKLGCNVG